MKLMHDMPRGGLVRRGLAAAVLTVSAGLTGPALPVGLCYWGGRLQTPGLVYAPAADAPVDAPFILAASAAALGWLGLWLLFARAQRWKRFGWLFAAAPLALFCWAAWRAAGVACAVA
jgi:hypothetical protein